MCGLVAHIGRRDPVLVSDMLSRLRHRGPDASLVSDVEAGTLGHARLAIIDLDGGSQPMWNAAGTVCVVFNGEIYNCAELRSRRVPDRAFRTRSDTEVLLAMIERFGDGAPDDLDGMFAYVAVRNGRVYAARDPLGIKPLYFARGDDGTLTFASERKAFRNPAAAEEFPPGHAYASDTGFRRYRAFTIGPSVDSDVRSIIPAVRSLLEAAVRKRMVADVPVGVFLSGGLDSSIVAALMCRERPAVHSFAAGISGAPDLEAARTMAAHLGTIHHEVVYTPDDMRRSLPDVIRHLESFDQPLVRSAVPNYFLARLAREHVKVVLTGEGADELFAGYDRYEALETDTALAAALFHDTMHLYNTNLQRTDRMTMAFSIEARVPFLDTAVVEYSHRIASGLKRRRGHVMRKQLLRAAFADLLPPAIATREKLKFSEGAGSAGILAAVADETIPDQEYARERTRANAMIRTKEELLLYRTFVDCFGLPAAACAIGRTDMRTE